MPDWLDQAVFYEIYPQSFCDSNGDGIGDLPGIVEKLDYLKDLGVNALWINPCFDSPFKDAGYDVRDYRKIAPRYGTNQDMARLFQQAHSRGIRVLLDLVPGHTSEEHPWFLMSGQAEENPYWGRYVWTDFCFQGADGLPFVGGEFPRNGTYALNFFKCQPALNYGFYQVRQPWQKPVDHPDCLATGQAIREVMRFWLDMGCDGFRVDMAASLVKNDDAQHSGTQAFWRGVRRMLDAEYPQAALVAEWGEPRQALAGGFHMDFYLNDENGYTRLARNYQGWREGRVEGQDRSFFKAGGCGIEAFWEDYLPRYQGSKDQGLFCLISGNHDTMRLRANLTPEEMKLFFAMLYTMPGAPFLYYGDEIGMRYLRLPTKEGGYFRTGSRTPMQWAPGENLGFSQAPAQALYLPVDPAPDAPTVAEQQEDGGSLLSFVRQMIALRLEHPALWSGAPFEPLTREGRLMAYRRGDILVAIAPEAGLRLKMDGAYAFLFTYGECGLESGWLAFDGPGVAVLERVRQGS